MDSAKVLDGVRQVAEGFAAARPERQLRRELDPADFAALADAGFLLTGVPAEQGGLWESVPTSTRPVAEILRALGRGDSSVALVSSMHPAVLSFWLATPSAPDPHTEAWREQRESVTNAAVDGEWWGTITSEPGSGGDVGKTKAVATPDGNGGFRLTGQKHFGSGSGVTSFMITTAVAEGEDAPDWFFLDVRDVPWDGSAGVKLLAPWDGHGMAATQSHSMMFEGAAAARMAWPGNWRGFADNAAPFIGTLFTAVILGVVEEAMATARRDLSGRADSLTPFEQVEWVHAEKEAWLMAQAYEGTLRAVETRRIPHRDVLTAKTAGADLAESVLRRLCRIMGGGTFGRRSPYGHWFEDVRALGFLRPPWPLAFDALVASSFMDLGDGEEDAEGGYFGGIKR
jgi:alkylation response protein AidB-like acyl-CoA dehydrogenase